MSDMNYDTWVRDLANLCIVSTADTNFLSILPSCRDYAEQRIYREIDFLRTQITDATASLSSGNRDFTLSTSVGTFITVDNANVITPVTATASNGTRNPLVPVSRDYLDLVYPSGQTVTGVPQYYAMASDTELILGPAPDAAYRIETIGTQRPTPLSSSNSSTYLTQYIPDVFLAASMVFMTGYLKDYGAQSDDPKMSNSWEGEYTKLMQSAAVEQFRAAFKGPGWTSQTPNPIATPPRV